MAIYMNEKLWLLKGLLFFSTFAIGLSFSNYHIFFYGIAIKYISMASLILQLNMLHDSIFIFVDKTILQNLKNDSKFDKILKILFCYVTPSVLAAFFFVYAYGKYSGVCGTYFTIITGNGVFCLFLIGKIKILGGCV